MFVFLSGLKKESTGGQSYVDLCAVAEALLGGYENTWLCKRSTTSGPIPTDQMWIVNFLVPRLASKLAIYLRRFPEDIIQPIPLVLGANSLNIVVVAFAIIGMPVGVMLGVWFTSFLVFLISYNAFFWTGIGLAIFCEHLRGLWGKTVIVQLARRMSDNWLVGLVHHFAPKGILCSLPRARKELLTTLKYILRRMTEVLFY